MEKQSQSKVYDSGQGEVYVHRKYKDRLFRMIFQDKENLLSLYNALNGTCYDNAEELEVVTLENAIYINMKNDLAFILDFYLNMYEHQSSFNPNMPLRFLQYIAREYEKLMLGKSLYYTNLVKIPTPQFVVFYNGKEEQPAEQILRLSDAFKQTVEEPELELKVRVLNINIGNNKKLLNQCKVLREYAEYVERVRLHQKNMELPAAVERAVDECIKEGILSDFLSRNRSEAIKMSIFECDEEEIIRGIREDEFEQGKTEGIIEGKSKGRSEGETIGRAKSILELLNECGIIPEELSQCILQESNPETLKKWLKLAAKVDSIDEFISMKD